MAIHYPNPADGFYWVHIHLKHKNNKNDWALGQVKNGNFRWLTKLNGFRIDSISINELLNRKILMVKIEKPTISFDTP